MDCWAGKRKVRLVCSSILNRLRIIYSEMIGVCIFQNIQERMMKLVHQNSLMEQARKINNRIVGE